ncbi:MAG: hypothetical protein V6Z86_07410 [Hyphomicrobiales bacterium]
MRVIDNRFGDLRRAGDYRLVGDQMAGGDGMSRDLRFDDLSGQDRGRKAEFGYLLSKCPAGGRRRLLRPL